jgi:hypothetical protein
MRKEPIDDQDSFARLSGLMDFAGNTRAIDASIARLCSVAKGYSDHELRRFAQLIIMYDHSPGQWREDLLTETFERDDAIEEIAMSIDHSWISTEVENEIFVDEFRNEVIRSCPNPNRIGCPDESALRRVVLGKTNQYSDSQALTEHTIVCGPCMRQVCIFLKEKARLKYPSAQG